MAFAEPSDGGRIVKETGLKATVLLHGTVQPGDPVYNDGTGFVRADASDDAHPCHAIAVNGGVSGDYIDVAPEAIIDFGTTCTATHGAHLYLSDTAGDYSASTGTDPLVIGRMLGAQLAHVWGIHSN